MLKFHTYNTYNENEAILAVISQLNKSIQNHCSNRVTNF